MENFPEIYTDKSRASVPLVCSCHCKNTDPDAATRDFMRIGNMRRLTERGVKAMQELVARHDVACIDKPDSDGYTPLMNAIRSSFFTFAEVLVDRGVCVQRVFSYTDLLNTSIKNDADLAFISKLLAAGVDANARIPDGRSRLHVACYTSCCENPVPTPKTVALVRLLTAHGARLDMSTSDRYVIRNCIIDDRTEMFDILMQTRPDVQNTGCLMLAVMNKRENMARALIVAGANVNQINGFVPERELWVSPYATPLQMAVVQGLHSVVYELVVHGADVDAPYRDGETPLTRARKSPRAPCSVALFTGLCYRNTDRKLMSFVNACENRTSTSILENISLELQLRIIDAAGAL